MAIGERIKFIRNLRGMTQKYLGMAVGFDEKTADVRMAQYESGKRTPKEKLVNDVANALGTSPQALTVPDIESYVGLMHTLFALEDIYGFKIGCIDGEVCITLDKEKGVVSHEMLDRLNAWHEEFKRLQNGEITKEEYDTWRYSYPKAIVEETKVALDTHRSRKTNN